MDKWKNKILKKLFNKESQSFERLFANADHILTDNERSDHAKAMLDNPVFNDAVSEMEKELLSMWKSSTFGDEEGRQEIYIAYQAIQKLKLKLQAYANHIRINELVKTQEEIYRSMVV